MSAKLAEKLAEVADLYNQLGEACTELSALFDAASAKSGKTGDDGAAGKVSGRGGKAGVAPKKGGRSKAPEVDLDMLKAKAKEAVAKLGREAVTEILGGKTTDVDEEEYADKYAELEAAMEGGGEEEEEDLPDPKAAAGKGSKTPAKKTGGKAKKVTEADVRAAAKKVIEKHGKNAVTKILGGKLADVSEDDYADKVAELEEAFEADEFDAGDDDDDV